MSEKQQTVHIVTGLTGAGKTTYSLKLAEDRNAIRFSIDEWMARLFHPDMTELSYEWIMDRIARCDGLIWRLAAEALERKIDVVLDLGFTTRAHRDAAATRAEQVGALSEVHFIDAAPEVRRARVRQRNEEKPQDLYAFEVNDFMFDFMEPRFERPDETELVRGVHVVTG